MNAPPVEPDEIEVWPGDLLLFRLDEQRGVAWLEFIPQHGEKRRIDLTCAERIDVWTGGGALPAPVRVSVVQERHCGEAWCTLDPRHEGPCKGPEHAVSESYALVDSLAGAPIPERPVCKSCRRGLAEGAQLRDAPDHGDPEAPYLLWYVCAECEAVEADEEDV